MFINGIEVIDSFSFGAGFMFCIVSDILFSIANYFFQKFLLARQKRKFFEHFSDYTKSKEVE